MSEVQVHVAMNIPIPLILLFLRVELLGHTAYMCRILISTTKLPSRKTDQFARLSVMKGALCSHSHQQRTLPVFKCWKNWLARTSTILICLYLISSRLITMFSLPVYCGCDERQSWRCGFGLFLLDSADWWKWWYFELVIPKKISIWMLHVSMLGESVITDFIAGVVWLGVTSAQQMFYISWSLCLRI